MNIALINEKILEVFQFARVSSFPVDCLAIMSAYKISLHRYSQQSLQKQEQCHMVSDDAFTFRRQVFYNDLMPENRIRFSLMHELGHILLNHGQEPTPDMEQEANYFSGHLLAPRLAIHYAHCQNEEEVAKVFQVGRECARYAFQDYRRWSRQILHRAMTPTEKSLYKHFYDKQSNQFVYHRNQCYLCGETALNSRDGLCCNCKKSFTANTIYNSTYYDGWLNDSE